jgi:thiamine pyrophosphate-dependent acetolactate synthase large subunit-like protein
VFGASFSEHTGIAPYQPTIQVDLDPLALGKVHPITVPLRGEIGITARLLLERLPGSSETEDQRAEVAERWALWREEKKSRARDDRGQGIPGAALFAALNRTAPDDAVMTVDVGNNTYSFGRYFECTSQSVLMSGYLGSIGFAFPAAMGAWAAAPERPILAIAGDGGFAQYLAELTTAVKYGMNITLVLVNNSELGKISNEQRAIAYDVWQTSLHNPDFAAYARLCGAHGQRVETRDELEEAMAAAIDHPGPAVVDVVSDPQLV